MAIADSGLYGIQFKNSLLNDAAVSWDTSVKVLMCTDSYTPNFDTHDFRDDITNEVSGTGYSAGGTDLVSPAITIGSPAAGQMKWDATDTTWAGSTIANAMAAVPYENVGTAGTDRLISLADFVTAASTTAGTFTIQWGTNGIVYFDYVVAS